MTLINKILIGVSDQNSNNTFFYPSKKSYKHLNQTESELRISLRTKEKQPFEANEGTNETTMKNIYKEEPSSSSQTVVKSGEVNSKSAAVRRLARAPSASSHQRQPESLGSIGSEKQQVSSNNSEDSGSGEEEMEAIENGVSNASIHDDNYESANDESNSSQKQPMQSDRVASLARIANTVTGQSGCSSSSGSNKVQKLQLRSARQSNSIIKHNNNLARGRQQRASISSCSSSDSYASYGSGYASGSGNSTDHELKQQRSLNNNIINSQNSEENQTVAVIVNDNKSKDTFAATLGKNTTTTNTTTTNTTTTTIEAEADADDDDDDVEVDEEEEANVDDDGDESQLKRHLSELEQLTDELSNRKIFGILTQPLTQTVSSTTKHHNHNDYNSPQYHHHLTSNASTIKSTSSSILSTGSNASSLLSSASSSSVAVNDTQVQSSTSSTTTAYQLTAGDTCTSDSRSTSATPTSTVHQQQEAICPSYKSAYLNRISLSNNEEMAVQVELDRATQQYASPLKSSPKAKITIIAPQKQQPQAQTQQVASKSPSSTGTGKQEPYYHNQLFQWEQLISKGVTRPLLINGLDFTDLRDEDDCDLLTSGNNNSNCGGKVVSYKAGEPLTINIPAAQQSIQGSLNLINEHDAVDDGRVSPKSRGDLNSSSPNTPATPATAPPPMPPPPISPWFNTISNSSIYLSQQSNQFLSSPSPPCEYVAGVIGSSISEAHNQTSFGDFCRDQSPANSTYSNYSRNSVCVPQTNTSITQLQYNTMQPLTSLRSASSMSSLLFGNNGGKYLNKRKKTMKLFWKEVREDRSLLAKLTKKHTIWDEIKPVQIDTQKLESLFESKAKDLMLSKSRIGLDSLGQRKVKITVLDAKRSNAINIGMTKLPPMRTIKSAILKMDSSIMNREGIEKILSTMMPSEEEKSRIIEAQLANPETPLGTAEQFLLNLASISALEARLKLWAFQLDYAQIEKEVAEPLMDLKQAIDEIERCETFRIILGTLLAIGNFLNSTNAKGFQIDYLEKVPEVKDTVHKHSLLHHLCLFIQEKYDPQSTSDLYSEFSAVNRASKVDYSEVAKNLKKMQQDCKSSWDYLKIVTKHDGLANLMNTCSSSTQVNENSNGSLSLTQQTKSSGKLNNLSRSSMLTTLVNTGTSSLDEQQSATPSMVSQNINNNNSKHLKTRVSDFLTDCAERIMVLMVIHRRVMNRFQKLLVYLGCPSHQIKQTQPQQILKIINEFALEYRTKRERVREMLAKKQQCQHHRHHQHISNRWQMNRSHWAGSQQCMDTLGYNNRPCSTTSSCASSYTANSICNESICNLSLTGESRHQANQNGSNRACSPSAFSQISNYSDYLFDQSCCDSRQQSVTPVPSGGNSSFNQQQQQLARRPHSMSVSMFDLQNKQQNSLPNCSVNAATKNQPNINSNNNLQDDEIEQQIQKDAQLRRILGAGKSMDGTCSDLYQMSHWTSTIARVTRHPLMGYPKQRAASIDSTSKNEELESAGKRQSSYYRYLPMQSSIDDEREQNSDDEILQSLVRTATAKSTHNSQNDMSAKSGNGTSFLPNANKGAKNKILSRFSCDRKSSK